MATSAPAEPPTAPATDDAQMAPATDVAAAEPANAVALLLAVVSNAPPQQAQASAVNEFVGQGGAAAVSAATAAAFASAGHSTAALALLGHAVEPRFSVAAADFLETADGVLSAASAAQVRDAGVVHGASRCASATIPLHPTHLGHASCPTPRHSVLAIARRTLRDAQARLPAALRILRAIIYSGALVPQAQLKAAGVGAGVGAAAGAGTGAAAGAAAGTGAGTAACTAASPGLAARVLTSLHAPFLVLALSARDFSVGVELAASPVVDVVPPSAPASVDAASVQLYFFAAGCVLAGARAWPLAAAALLKAAAGLPRDSRSAVAGANATALEAYKKWLLVAAIAAPLGAAAPALPPSHLSRLLGTAAKPYEALAVAAVATDSPAKVRALLADAATAAALKADGNGSLAAELEAAAQARRLQKLAATHERLSFRDVVRLADLAPDTPDAALAALLRRSSRAWGAAGLTARVDEGVRSLTFIEESVDAREAAARAAHAGLSQRVADVTATLAAVRAADEAAAVPTRKAAAAAGDPMRLPR